MRDTGYWKGKERGCRSSREDPGCTAREAEVSERDCTRSRSGSIWGYSGGGGGGIRSEIERLSLIEGVRKSVGRSDPPVVGSDVRDGFRAWAALGIWEE
jgi:hypothetical protein